MANLIDRANEAAAVRTIIPDPTTAWGIDPRANAEVHNHICLTMKTLAEGEVSKDLKSNLMEQIAVQVKDYAESGLEVPDA